jgi:Glycosyl transferase family 2
MLPAAERCTQSTGSAFDDISIAVIIPCFNEGSTIAQVVSDFRAALPAAEVYVYDNNSTDDTADRAAKAGAVVRHEVHQGKGHVVRRMFADISADAYVLVDGDATYHAPSAPVMVARLLEDRLDMIVGARVDQVREAYRVVHRMGNRLLTGTLAILFGRSFTDVLSGYRVFSRRFVKSFPGLSEGFEIESELTEYALEVGASVSEIQTPYFARPTGSVSKLRTWRDGIRILWTIARLCKSEHPMATFSVIAVMLASLSVALAVPLFVTYLEQGRVPRLPTAVLSTGIMLLAFLCFTSGLILGTVTRGRREAKRIAYLSYDSPGGRKGS